MKNAGGLHGYFYWTSTICQFMFTLKWVLFHFWFFDLNDSNGRLKVLLFINVKV